jgi:hypothetical protein
MKRAISAVATALGGWIDNLRDETTGSAAQLAHALPNFG